MEAYDKEKISASTTNVAQFKQLGAEILAQVYQSKFSEWKFQTPEDIDNRHAEIDAGLSPSFFVSSLPMLTRWTGWEKLSEFSAVKKEILQDDLAREQFKEKVRLLNEEHIDKHAKLLAWSEEPEAYLKKREEVNSVSEAQTQLSLLEAYQVKHYVIDHFGMNLTIPYIERQTRHHSDQRSPTPTTRKRHLGAKIRIEALVVRIRKSGRNPRSRIRHPLALGRTRFASYG